MCRSRAAKPNEFRTLIDSNCHFQAGQGRPGSNLAVRPPALFSQRAEMNSHRISPGVSRRFLGSVDRHRELHGGFPAGAVKLPRIPDAVLPGTNCEKVFVHRRTMRSAAIKCQRHDSGVSPVGSGPICSRTG